MKTRSYYRSIGTLKQDLGAAMPREELRFLHKVEAWRHFLVAFRHFAIFAACGWAMWQNDWPWLWPFAALLQGANFLGFLILVHEQVHQVIFAKSRPRLERLLGLLYAMPTGISISQFGRWHLDHHNELGHPDDDPKRAHLSPKINARWLKLLYLTPALFVIYARASRQEASTYPPELQRTIVRERILNGIAHFAVMAALLAFGGGGVLLRVYVIPLFFCFPPFFVLNRLGQHFDIDPSDPAKWSSLVNGNAFWRFVFLWSNFHIEHHYYQRVPFYRLKRLNEKLQPFFRRRGIKNHSYTQLIWDYLVRNRKAHTNWSLEG